MDCSLLSVCWPWGAPRAWGDWKVAVNIKHLVSVSPPEPMPTACAPWPGGLEGWRFPVFVFLGVRLTGRESQQGWATALSHQYQQTPALNTPASDLPCRHVLLGSTASQQNPYCPNPVADTYGHIGFTSFFSFILLCFIWLAFQLFWLWTDECPYSDIFNTILFPKKIVCFIKLTF